MSTSRSLVIAALLLVSNVPQASELKAEKVSASAGDKDVLIMSAPPRETPEAAKIIYQPVADYLSKVIGKPIVYKYPRTFGVYRTEMLMGKYDIVFDGPNFVGYRVAQLQHNVLAKFSAVREMYIFVRKNDKIVSTAELEGKTICTQVPPNVDGLVALMPFENPARQPVIVPVRGREAIFNGVMSGHCAAGVIPSPDWASLDKDGTLTKVLFKSQPILDQAITAGPRISREDYTKMAAALVAPEAAGPTEKLRVRMRGGDSFVPATNAEYAVFAPLLKGQWGFF